MLFKCAVSFVVSCLPQRHLLMERSRLAFAYCNQRAREVCFLSWLLYRGRSPEWLRHHRLNSLQRSKSSGNAVDPVASGTGFKSNAMKLMLFRRAVSFVVSCLRQGQLFTARVRLIGALFSHNAREASVLSSLLWRGHLPE